MNDFKRFSGIGPGKMTAHLLDNAVGSKLSSQPNRQGQWKEMMQVSFGNLLLGDNE